MLSLLTATAFLLQDQPPTEDTAIVDTDAQVEDEMLPAPPTDAPTLITQFNGDYVTYGDFIADLASRRARERFLTEEMLSVISRTDLDDGAQGAFLAEAGQTIAAVEADNTAWARAQLDPEYFIILYIDRPREATELLRWAGRDEDARSQIVAALEPVAIEGLYDGLEFARIADALAVDENRPQVFGTATECVDGVVALWPLEDPASTDMRRADLGLLPLADTPGVLGTPCSESD